MYIEVREKNAKYYVIVRHEDSVEKPMAHFASSSKEEAANVGRQFAKQHKCLIRYTSGGIETPALPTPPQAEG